MSQFVPRPYQHLIRNFIFDNPRCNVFASPGMGKTSSTVEAFAELKLFGEAKRMLVLAPKRVAETSWPAERDKWRESFGHLSMAAAIGTPAQRLAALRSTPDILTTNYENIEWLLEQYGDNWPFDMVAADECFVSGTLVETPTGRQPIETLSVGDLVLTSRGPKKVTYVYEKSTESLVEVRLVNGTRIVCTPCHLFWTESGWQKAEDLGSTSALRSAVPPVWSDVRPRAEQGDSGVSGSFLLAQLQHQKLGFADSDARPPGAREKDERMAKGERRLEQGGADARQHQGKTQRRIEGSGFGSTGESRRQRSRNEPRRDVGFATPGSGVGLEPSDQDEGGCRTERTNGLQTGLRMAGENGLLGGGRGFPQGRLGTSAGPQEGEGFARTWVERVSRVKCSGRTVVWDIEVEDAHEYFAGGVLVHNCTRLKGLRISLQRRQKKDGTWGNEFIAGQGGKRSKALAHVAHKHVRRWVNLTGSPAPNGLVDVWGQQWFVDGGRRLGNSFDAFSQRWFRMVHGSSREQQRIEPMPFAQEQIQALMAQTSITVDAKDWFDIKSPIERHIEIDLPPRARKMYDEMQRELFTWIDAHPLEAFSAGTKSLKCLQIASGSVIHDKDGNWSPVHDEKIEALRSIVEETNGESLLVAYQYRADLERILKAFPRARTLAKNSDQTIKDFQAGKVPMLVVHPASAGHGLDLQHNCRTLVDYSTGFNLEYDEQVIERIGPTRQAQLGKDCAVFRYRIVARNTIEQTVAIPRLISKASVQDSLKAAMKHKC